MTINNFKKVRIAIGAFIGATVGIAVTLENIPLAIAGVLIGILFMLLVKRRIKAVMVDERIKMISGNAGYLTYAISTVMLAVFSLMFLMIGKGNDLVYFESLGATFSYIALFNIAVYALAFRFFNSKT